MVSVIALPLPALDQLTQITEKLLAAEEKKLKVLKAEIQASKRHSDKAGDHAAKVRLQSMAQHSQGTRCMLYSGVTVSLVHSEHMKFRGLHD